VDTKNNNLGSKEFPPELKEEIGKIYSEALQQLSVAQSKYEDISKLLTGLTAGALVLSVSLLSKKDLSVLTKHILLFSWIVFLVSLGFGVYVLWNVYKVYEKRGLEYKKLAEDVKKDIEEARKHITGRLRVEFEWGEIKKRELQIESKKWLLLIQLIAFAIGVFLLTIYGFLILFN
jgi:hypothetical protein